MMMQNRASGIAAWMAKGVSEHYAGTLVDAEDENYKRRLAEGYRSMQGMVEDNRWRDMAQQREAAYQTMAYGDDRTLAFAAHERAKLANAGRRAVATEHESIFGKERKPEPTDYAYDHPLTLFDRIRAKIHARNP